jgi:hypothetical protein
MTSDQLSPEDVQRVTDDLGELWIRLHWLERRLGLSGEERAESGDALDVDRLNRNVARPSSRLRR